MEKLFAEHRIWERARGGEFEIVSQEASIEPFVDENGSRCNVEETWVLVDRRFPACLIGRTGVPTAQEITIKGVRYRELSREDPRCALCEESDPISPWRREVYSTYRPRYRIWHEAWRRIRIARRKLKPKSGPNRAALGQ